MASYKIVPLLGGKFAVAIDEGGEHPIVSGPYKTISAARAYIDEHQRSSRTGREKE